MIFTLFETLECLQIDFLGTFFKAISAVFEILTISVLKTGWKDTDLKLLPQKIKKNTYLLCFSVASFLGS